MELNINKIHKEMRRLGWSKADLGKAMGCRRQWIDYKLRNFGNKTTFRTLERFAKALDIDPKDLIK